MTLEWLIKQLEENGYNRNDYKNIEFDLCYDDCYYESSEPDFVFKVKNES